MSPPVRTAPPSSDLPLGLFVAVVIVLTALFLPMARRTPDYPTALPPLTYDADAVLREHARALALPAPPATAQVLARWRALNEATAARRESEFSAAQAAFTSDYGLATGHAPSAEQALRARAREAFLGESRRPEAALTRVAARHRLAGPRATRDATTAVRVAWFDLRWERNALPTPEHGEVEPIATTLLRIPPPEQRAFTAWALAARCPVLVGVEGRPLRPDDARRCASLRRDLLDLAAGFDHAYPRDEAAAAIDMMLGESLLRLTDPARADAREPTVVDDNERLRARDDALAAFQHAAERYGAMERRGHSARIERYLRAALAELGADPS